MVKSRVLIERVKQKIEPGKKIARGTVPIPYTGNYNSARVCFISLNPREFYRGDTLKKDHPIARKQFNKKDNEPLDDTAAQAILNSCDTYFVGRPLIAYFEKHEKIMQLFGPYTYTDGSCVLLDLVQWETYPLWGNLDPATQEYHLARDHEILSQLLEKDFNYLFLNGAAVVTTMKNQFDLDLTEQEITVGNHQRKLFFGRRNKTTVIGWSPFFGKRFSMNNTDFVSFLNQLKKKYTRWAESGNKSG
jgi:hypothetical protein